VMRCQGVPRLLTILSARAAIPSPVEFLKLQLTAHLIVIRNGVVTGAL
jgi:hypothetical protein